MNFHLLLNRCHCDYRCIFCTMGSDTHRAEQEAILAHFDWDAERQRIEQVLADAAKRPGAEALHIMGNDPCNQPHLLSIVQRARDLGFRRIVLETNGLKLADADFTAQLVDAGVQSFKIPVYGSSADIHDGIVRRPGAFDLLRQAFERLGTHPVEVHLHALILRQNVADLLRCEFPFPLGFRFPFAHDRADFTYEHYAPRLRDVPAVVLKRSDVVIPCVNGRKAQTLPREERTRPEAPAERDRDTHVAPVRPACCTPRTCPEYDGCRGIYRCYLETYGDEEFRHGSRWRTTVAIRAARLAPKVAQWQSRTETLARGRLAGLALRTAHRLTRRRSR